jgi:acyl-CoA synthetase (AMP-forming)/AMP-acid ligase II
MRLDTTKNIDPTNESSWIDVAATFFVTHSTAVRQRIRENSKFELINVVGEKVYPQEVENVVIDFDGITDVTVYSETHPIAGNIVCAKINVENVEDKKQFIKELKQHCKSSFNSLKFL